MELHTCLWNDVRAFSFTDRDLDLLREQCPQIRLTVHQDQTSFLQEANTATTLLTWEFPQDWYQHCPNLTQILTPAAGNDWVSPDPMGRVSIIHGTFHGPLLAESLLSALFYMNHRMPAMQKNFADKQWDRNLQAECRALADQCVFIIGYGSIGQHAANLIGSTGAKVVGVNRAGQATNKNHEIITTQQLDERIHEADHVVLLLPGDHSTDRFMHPDRIRACKPGVHLYNFGRGNALLSKDIIETQQHIGGAFLDVTDEEPLPPASPLWTQPNIMITPHSSCVYDNYRELFLKQVIALLNGAS